MIICCIVFGLCALLWILFSIFDGSDAGDGCLGFGLLFSILAFFIGLSLIINYISLPETNAKNAMRYNTVVYEIEHLEECNVHKVLNDVYEWNEWLIEARCGKTSPWVNWWYSADLSNFQLLELDTSQSCPCCGRPLSQPVKVVESDSR